MYFFQRNSYFSPSFTYFSERFTYFSFSLNHKRQGAKRTQSLRALASLREPYFYAFDCGVMKSRILPAVFSSKGLRTILVQPSCLFLNVS